VAVKLRDAYGQSSRCNFWFGFMERRSRDRG